MGLGKMKRALVSTLAGIKEAWCDVKLSRDANGRRLETGVTMDYTINVPDDQTEVEAKVVEEMITDMSTDALAIAINDQVATDVELAKTVGLAEVIQKTALVKTEGVMVQMVDSVENPEEPSDATTTKSGEKSEEKTEE